MLAKRRRVIVSRPRHDADGGRWDTETRHELVANDLDRPGRLAGLWSPVSADEPTPADHLAPLARFVGGEWVGRGKHDADSDFRTRVVYEWGIDKKLLKAKSYLKGEGGETLVYESVFAWHPAKKAITLLSVVVADDSSTTPSSRGRRLASIRLHRRLGGDKTTAYRQSIRFLDDDHTEWTVFAKKGDEWVKVIESTQERRKPEARVGRAGLAAIKLRTGTVADRRSSHQWGEDVGDANAPDRLGRGVRVRHRVARPLSAPAAGVGRRSPPSRRPGR